MSEKIEKPLSEGGGNPARTEMAVVLALVAVAIAPSTIMAGGSKWDSLPTAIGTNVEWYRIPLCIVASRMRQQARWNLECNLRGEFRAAGRTCDMSKWRRESV